MASSSSASSLSTSSVQALAIRDVWTQRAETVILPVLRYCQYESRDALTAEEIRQVTRVMPNATTATFKTDASAIGTNNSIVLNFRGRDIALDADASYQPIAVLYLKMEESLQNPDTLDENQFLQLLSDLDDAVQKVSDEMKKYRAIPNPGPAVTAKLATLAALEGWFRYHKLSIWSYQQEQHIAEFNANSSNNAVDMVYLYEALQENAARMVELPGQDNEDDPYQLEALAHVVRFRAHRCYHLALAHEQETSSLLSSSSSSFKRVLALLQQASKLADRAREEIMACHDDPLPAVVERHVHALDELTLRIRAVTSRVEATRYLMNRVTPTTNATTRLTKTDRPLWMRLEDCDAGTVLADLPVRPIPIPCKGVTYDLAGSRLCRNDELVLTRERYIAEHNGDTSSTNQDGPMKKAGFLGWFS